MKIARLSVFLALPVLVALAGCMMSRPNPDADVSTTRTSRNGAYVVTYVPEVTPVPKRKLHAWTFEVRDAAGTPIEGARISIDGGMPDHGHGLPTRPAVRQALGGGRYVVDGMKFNMGGYWVVDLDIASVAGSDTVRFELNL